MIEWAAFMGSLVSVFLYGKKGIKGPIPGMMTSLLFMMFGYFHQVPAAIISNVVFMVLHFRNFRSEIMQDESRFIKKMTDAGNHIMSSCYKASYKAGWWTDIETKKDIETKEIVPVKIALIHSELSEALEAHRKNLMDDKLPHRQGVEVELADAVIRIADLAGALGLDLGGAIAEKMIYNENRLDHKVENRVKAGGKAY